MTDIWPVWVALAIIVIVAVSSTVDRHLARVTVCECCLDD